VSKQKHEN